MPEREKLVSILIKKSNFFCPLSSTPKIEEWTNLYVQFYVDWAFEMGFYLLYYSVHVMSASFYIGLSFYVNAMLIDLKLRLRKIDRAVETLRNSSGLEIGRKLSDEIDFHAHIFE